MTALPLGNSLEPIELQAWDGPEPEEPTDAELLSLWPDPFAGPPDGEDAWLADLSVPELDVLAEQWAAENGTGIEAIAAGFTHDTPGEGAPVGFAAGGALDQMIPDPVLAGFAAEAFDAGLAKLSDDEVVGVLKAARRLSSWQAWMEFTAVSELDDRRRAATERMSSRATEHLSDELAAALTLTGRSADSLLTLTRDLARLPQVLRALKTGVIDRAKAAVFAAELAGLNDRLARMIAAALWRAAGGMTTGQLRAELRALALMADPHAARRRRERARGDTRVEVWQEGSGNSAIAGRELLPADVITADKRISAIAKELKQAGMIGTMDQLRSAVFAALLTGQDLATLLPPRVRATSGDTLDSVRERLAGMTGKINLTMPLSAWAGWSQAPGEAAGLGPVDADTCRDLADRLASASGTRWCLTLIDDDGQAAGHACARAGPGPSPQGLDPHGLDPHGPSPPGKDPPRADLAAWLRSLPIEWLERHPCGHGRQVKGYRTSAKLAHLIRIRQRTCAAPGCRRPAETCDLDHTIPYDQGGPTCQCNLGALCRRHHRAKQAPGWQLTQAEPGRFTWQTPHGRTYSVRPDPYPV